MSDDFLKAFNIGIYKDNTLTHKMRFEDKKNFVYLIRQRNLSLLIKDQNGNNMIHFAISLEKIEFLSLMLEGTFKGDCMQKCS